MQNNTNNCAEHFSEQHRNTKFQHKKAGIQHFFPFTERNAEIYSITNLQ